MAAIRAGHQDLFPEAGRSTWDQLRNDLSQYTLAEVLDVVARASAVLDAAHATDEATQLSILVGLAGRSDLVDDIRRRFAAMGRPTGSPPVILFEPQQLLSLSKAALLCLPPDSNIRPSTRYDRILAALLRISDLISPHAAEQPQPDGHLSEEMTRYFFALGMFYRGGLDLHEIARFRELCLRSHTELRGDPDYMDFADLAEKATGLPVAMLWRGLTVLMSKWKSIDLKDAVKGSAFIDESDFLSANFHFTREEESRILAVATADADSIQRALRLDYSFENFRPFDYVPLASKPLVRIGNRVFCVCLPLLTSKLADGLYFVLANSCRGKDRDKFTRFLGVVFEQYVFRLLSRMFARLPATIINGKDLRDAAAPLAPKDDRPKTADAVVLIQGIAVLVESKVRYFARAAREGADWEPVVSTLESTYSHASGQLESTIELTEAGVFRGLGLRPEDISRYVPVVVALDEMPILLPQIYDLIRPVAPHSAADKTAPIQVIGVGELEPLEDAVARGGLNLHFLLDYKGARSGRHAQSLRNFVLQDPSLRHFSTRSPFLAELYNDAMRDALAFMQSRRR